MDAAPSVPTRRLPGTGGLPRLLAPPSPPPPRTRLTCAWPNCGSAAPREGFAVCSACRAPYCSRRCQAGDWLRHRPACHAAAGTRVAALVPSSSSAHAPAPAPADQSPAPSTGAPKQARDCTRHNRAAATFLRFVENGDGVGERLPSPPAAPPLLLHPGGARHGSPRFVLADEQAKDVLLVPRHELAERRITMAALGDELREAVSAFFERSCWRRELWGGGDQAGASA